ncbi:ribonuclease [Sphingopyxis sp. MWB1]|uniref:ribonuclease n=1 Tax=Sphingopyxis sp. MWB1 TaxID=1537715 RepID=UPI00051A7683|nr:ribonuclease [Sphingopyxis sp. MWB1]
MAEWLFEAGIGENRAALVEGGEIVEARIERDSDGPRLGAVLAGKLIAAGARPRVVLDWSGAPEATLATLPPSLSIGASLHVEITRMALRERGRDKLARAAFTDRPLTDGPDLRAQITSTGHPVTELHSRGPDRLEEAGWSELIDRVRAGRWPFAGGELWFDMTPAMLVIDIDGEGEALSLARAGAVAAARLLRCCGVGGVSGVDFPSLAGRADRVAVAEVFDAHLPQPYERTAINGFGFMQIVQRRSRPSLIEQLLFDPVATDTALLLRQAERAQGTGPLRLGARPAVAARLDERPDWIDLLQRRTGRPVMIERDEMMKGAGYAQ